MDFNLSDEQRLIQETVREFVDERVLPNAIENDIEHRLDMSVIEGMAELGLPSRARRSSAARPRSGR